MKRLRLDQIQFDEETQMRESLDMDIVSDYSADIRAGAKFPPVVVFFDGSEYWLGDGYHRWHATAQADQTHIECDVKRGTKRDAILFACGANSSHGLRRRNVDKHRAVMTLLKDAEWSQWSDRAIAEKCGVSQPTVSSKRAQLIKVISSEPTKPRKCLDGKSRRVKPAVKPSPVEPAPVTDEPADEEHGDIEWGGAGEPAYEPTQPEPAPKPVSYFARFRALWDEADVTGRAAIVAFVMDVSSGK